MEVDGMPNAWLLIASRSATDYVGNDGYLDDPSTSYMWDSLVAKHTSIAIMDRIVLWDSDGLIGVSIVDNIQTTSTVKNVYRCPNCDSAKFKARTTMLPEFRCSSCTHTFDERVSYEKSIEQYRTEHAAAWVPLEGLVAVADLRKMSPTPTSQHSIRPLTWSIFAAAVADSLPNGLQTLETVAKRHADGHKVRSLRVRVGQQAFRKRLIAEYGETCAFTGSCPPQALEACHLYSYAELGKHHSDGGLLLRSDIHSLFDQGKIRVDPESRRIHVDPFLLRYNAYAALAGETLKVHIAAGHWNWLSAHWELHR